MEYVIKTKSIGGMTEDEFFRFCQENESIDLERNPDGDIVIMEPVGNYTSWLNVNIATELTNWNRKAAHGVVFNSSAGFTLPNNAVRSPDAAFIRKDRWQKLSDDDRKKFAHIYPDFVVELLSQSDHEAGTRQKMQEWMNNGCRLAWLINPLKRETIIYRANGQTAMKRFHDPLDGEDVLPGFRVVLSELFLEP